MTVRKAKARATARANSRFPEGMTERKARANATAKTKATAGPSATLRFAQDDIIFLIWDEVQRLTADSLRE